MRVPSVAPRRRAAGGALLVVIAVVGAPSAGAQCFDYASSLRIDAHLGIPGGARGVVTSGSLAYVAAGHEGLAIVDLADPSAPGILTTVATDDYAYAVDVSGDRAVTAIGFGGLQVVTIANPAGAYVMGDVETPGSARDVILEGIYAFVADPYAGLFVVSIIDPWNPQIWASVVEVRPQALSAVGDHLYCAAGDDGLQLVDILVLQSPTYAGGLDLPGPATDVVVVGDVAYVAAGSHGVQLVDVASAPQLHRIGEYATVGDAERLAVSGATLLITEGGRLELVDIADPTTPAPIAVVATSGYADDVTVFGDHACVADDGLSLVDLARTATAAPLGSLAFQEPGHDLAIWNQHVVFASGSSVLVVDASDPTAPVHRNAIGIAGEPFGLAVTDDLVAVAAAEGGLRLHSLASVHGGLVGVALWDRLPVDVATVGERAYVADLFGVQVVDIADPSAPQLRGRIDLSASVYRIAAAGDLVVAVSTYAGAWIIDVGDDDAPAVLATVDLPGHGADVAIAGGHAYLLDQAFGLQVVDLSAGAPYAAVGSLDLPAHGSSLDVRGDRAFVAWPFLGTLVVDVSDPTRPRRLGDAGTAGAKGAVAGDDWVAVTGATPELTLYPPPCSTVTAVDDEAATRVARQTIGHPNPLTDRTAIRYALPVPGHVAVAIYDLAGRRVRTLTDRSAPAGAGQVVWDARDDAGQAVAAGVYLVRVKTPAATEVARVTVVR